MTDPGGMLWIYRSADRGGLDTELSLAAMLSILDPLALDVEIYRHDPMAVDDLFEQTRDWLLAHDLAHLVTATGIGKQYLRRVLEAVQSGEVRQLNQLARVQGVGFKTLERIFRSAMQAGVDRAPMEVGMTPGLF